MTRDNPAISIDHRGFIWIFSTSHGRSRPSYIHRSRKPFDILYITSKGYRSGPQNDPRTWTVAQWTGGQWKIGSVTTSDNNYPVAEFAKNFDFAPVAEFAKNLDLANSFDFGRHNGSEVKPVAVAEFAKNLDLNHFHR